MLLTVVFGIRKIRTPLIVGCCWIVGLWLSAPTLLPHARATTGVVRAGWEFVGAVGKLGVALIAAFGAYLLGVVTVQLLMRVLVLCSVPRDAKVLFLPARELAGRGPMHTTFRTDRVEAYVLRGILPPELRRPDLQNTFSRLCAEAEFRWVTPVPVAVLGIYLASAGFRWWLLLAGLTVLMVDGRHRFVMACRMLSRAGIDEAARVYAETANVTSLEEVAARRIAGRSVVLPVPSAPSR